MVSKLVDYNNFFSIKATTDRWKGSNGVVKLGNSQFVSFTKPIYSLRAFYRICRTYQSRGVSDLAGFVNRYAPACDNNSPHSYGNYICHQLNQDDNLTCFFSSVFSFSGILDNPTIFWSFACAVACYEMGILAPEYYFIDDLCQIIKDKNIYIAYQDTFKKSLGFYVPSYVLSKVELRLLQDDLYFQ